jgi:tryptophanyl-tRNA synthetase
MIVLTGIKPSGAPHLGNLVGAIRPALALAAEARRSFFVIADYHALTELPEPEALLKRTREVAAAWLAFGLDPKRALLYRQSDVPEVFELCWILTCLTPKGLLNRAHAYKAAGARAGGDADDAIRMGLYSYPLLMAADILAFDADLVPVGRDQVQHLEIARDLAARFNRHYGPLLKPPSYRLSVGDALPGLDGRKMSKSYENTIPLFAPADELRRLVSRIRTDSTRASDPKDPATALPFLLYRALVPPERAEEMERRLRAGISWGEVKEALALALEATLSGPRERYQKLLAAPEEIDTLLAEGAARARAHARPLLSRVRRAIGATAAR